MQVEDKLRGLTTSRFGKGTLGGICRQDKRQSGDSSVHLPPFFKKKGVGEHFHVNEINDVCVRRTAIYGRTIRSRVAE